MKRIIIKLRIEQQPEARRVVLPAEQKLTDLITNLVQGLRLMSGSDNNPSDYWLETSMGILDTSKTLKELDITDNTLLFLKSGPLSSKGRIGQLKPFDGEFIKKI